VREFSSSPAISADSSSRKKQPGVRVFGNLRSNRLAYNLAWFYFLEKNTNSGLKHVSESWTAGVCGERLCAGTFLAKGYTTEFSFHYNQDHGGLHFDDNGLLVRPAPVGAVVKRHYQNSQCRSLLPSDGRATATLDVLT